MNFLVIILHIRYQLIMFNDIIKSIESLNRRNQFENDRSMFNLEDIFRLMELEFQNVQNHIKGSDISTSKYFTEFIQNL